MELIFRGKQYARAIEALGAARSGFEGLLERHLLAFADHAAEFYAGSGNEGQEDRRRQEHQLASVYVEPTAGSPPSGRLPGRFRPTRGTVPPAGFGAQTPLPTSSGHAQP